MIVKLIMYLVLLFYALIVHRTLHANGFKSHKSEAQVTSASVLNQSRTIQCLGSLNFYIFREVGIINIFMQGILIIDFADFQKCKLCI